MKLVYVAMTADLLHVGHINLLRKASELGKVIVGLHTSNAIYENNDVVFLSYQQRYEVLSNISFVSEIIPQENASYERNIVKLKPDFVVHGDDWKIGKSSNLRKEVLKILEQWGGKLVEVPYTVEISTKNYNMHLARLGITIVNRVGMLRTLINKKKVVRVLESHNALSALIAENTFVENKKGDIVSFDGFWSSSLTDSTSRGKPDIEAIDLTSRLNTVNDIFEVTTKPMIFDADTGGKIEHFEFTVKSLERVGVSAVVIEDKTGLKKNSLFGNEVVQTQDSIENFCKKIEQGKKAQSSNEFMIIARVESLILEAGMEDALTRAHKYIESGADGIMIHSRHKDPSEIFEFVSNFRKNDITTPLVVVPTSFNTVTIDEFANIGVNVVISANHMLRAAYPAMQKVARSILENGRTYEAEPNCMSISEILEFIPGTR